MKPTSIVSRSTKWNNWRPSSHDSLLKVDGLFDLKFSSYLNLATQIAVAYNYSIISLNNSMIINLTRKCFESLSGLFRFISVSSRLIDSDRNNLVNVIIHKLSQHFLVVDSSCEDILCANDILKDSLASFRRDHTSLISGFYTTHEDTPLKALISLIGKTLQVRNSSRSSKSPPVLVVVMRNAEKISSTILNDLFQMIQLGDDSNFKLQDNQYKIIFLFVHSSSRKSTSFFHKTLDLEAIRSSSFTSTSPLELYEDFINQVATHLKVTLPPSILRNLHFDFQNIHGCVWVTQQRILEYLKSHCSHQRAILSMSQDTSWVQSMTSKKVGTLCGCQPVPSPTLQIPQNYLSNDYLYTKSSARSYTHLPARDQLLRNLARLLPSFAAQDLSATGILTSASGPSSFYYEYEHAADAIIIARAEREMKLICFRLLQTGKGKLLSTTKKVGFGADAIFAALQQKHGKIPKNLPPPPLPHIINQLMESFSTAMKFSSLNALRKLTTTWRSLLTEPQSAHYPPLRDFRQVSLREFNADLLSLLDQAVAEADELLDMVQELQQVFRGRGEAERASEVSLLKREEATPTVNDFGKRVRKDFPASRTRNAADQSSDNSSNSRILPVPVPVPEVAPESESETERAATTSIFINDTGITTTISTTTTTTISTGTISTTTPPSSSRKRKQRETNLTQDIQSSSLIQVDMEKDYAKEAKTPTRISPRLNKSPHSERSSESKSPSTSTSKNEASRSLPNRSIRTLKNASNNMTPEGTAKLTSTPLGVESSPTATITSFPPAPSTTTSRTSADTGSATGSTGKRYLTRSGSSLSSPQKLSNNNHDNISLNISAEFGDMENTATINNNNNNNNNNNGINNNSNNNINNNSNNSTTASSSSNAVIAACEEDEAEALLGDIPSYRLMELARLAVIDWLKKLTLNLILYPNHIAPPSADEAEEVVGAGGRSVEDASKRKTLSGIFSIAEEDIEEADDLADSNIRHRFSSALVNPKLVFPSKIKQSPDVCILYGVLIDVDKAITTFELLTEFRKKIFLWKSESLLTEEMTNQTARESMLKGKKKRKILTKSENEVSADAKKAGEVASAGSMLMRGSDSSLNSPGNLHGDDSMMNDIEDEVMEEPITDSVDISPAIKCRFATALNSLERSGFVKVTGGGSTVHRQAFVWLSHEALF